MSLIFRLHAMILSLCMLMVMALPILSLAQGDVPVAPGAPVVAPVTPTTPAVPAKIDFAQKVFDIVVMIAMTFLGPLITKSVGSLSPQMRYGLASLIGMILGAVTGEFTDFPLNTDTGAAAGLAMSSLGQKFLESQPPVTKT